jgi:hypothetical protein
MGWREAKLDAPFFIISVATEIRTKYFQYYYNEINLAGNMGKVKTGRISQERACSSRDVLLVVYLKGVRGVNSFPSCYCGRDWNRALPEWASGDSATSNPSLLFRDHYRKILRTYFRLTLCLMLSLKFKYLYNRSENEKKKKGIFSLLKYPLNLIGNKIVLYIVMSIIVLKSFSLKMYLLFFEVFKNNLIFQYSVL